MIFLFGFGQSVMTATPVLVTPSHEGVPKQLAIAAIPHWLVDLVDLGSAYATLCSPQTRSFIGECRTVKLRPVRLF